MFLFPYARAHERGRADRGLETEGSYSQRTRFKSRPPVRNGHDFSAKEILRNEPRD